MRATRARSSIRALLIAVSVLGGLVAAVSPGAGPPVVSARLAARLADDPGRPVAVWVYFTGRPAAGTVAPALSARSLERRARVFGEARLDARDLPVDPSYAREAAARAGLLRQRSRWLNAVSVETDAAGVEALSRLSFVRRLDLVRSAAAFVPAPEEAGPAKVADDLYGPSFGQLSEIHATDAHARGYSGAGVIVCMMDTGYMKNHVSLVTRPVLAEWDFVQHDGNTQNEGDDNANQHNHGTGTWSVLGGYMIGELIGPAYGASFVLAKTEDIRSETRIEEDNYVAGLEWADSLGADVVSASLAYREFDGGFEYAYEELDGDTAVTTIGVDVAVSRGIVCVNAMGNTGPNPGSLWTPADADSVIAVGAVDAGNAVANFSSRGPTGDGRVKPEVTARGVSTHWASAAGGTEAFSDAGGTSLATPLVGGGAALLVEAHPEWTPMQVRNALMTTASHAASPDNSHGWGRIHITNAIDSQPVVYPAPFSLVSPASGATTSGVRPTFVWRASPDPQSSPVSYTLFIDTDPEFGGPLVFGGIADTTATITTALASLTTYFWKVEAYDPESHARACRRVFTFTTPDVTEAGPPSPPAALSLAADPNPFAGSVRLRCSSPAGAPATLRVYSIGGRLVREIGAAPASGHDVVWDGRDWAGRQVPAGIYRVVLEANGAGVERKVIRIR
jgi:hypothetical protein